jgi:hypothetical protein
MKQTKLNLITAFFLIINGCLAVKPAVANPLQDIAKERGEFCFLASVFSLKEEMKCSHVIAEHWD